MAMENIRCDVDENLWPDQQERQDVRQEYFFFMDVTVFCFFSVFVVTYDILNAQYCNWTSKISLYM